MGVKIELDSHAIAKSSEAMKKSAQSTIHQLDEHLKNNSMMKKKIILVTK